MPLLISTSSPYHQKVFENIPIFVCQQSFSPLFSLVIFDFVCLVLFFLVSLVCRKSKQKKNTKKQNRWQEKCVKTQTHSSRNLTFSLSKVPQRSLLARDSWNRYLTRPTSKPMVKENHCLLGCRNCVRTQTGKPNTQATGHEGTGPTGHHRRETTLRTGAQTQNHSKSGEPPPRKQNKRINPSLRLLNHCHFSLFEP